MSTGNFENFSCKESERAGRESCHILCKNLHGKSVDGKREL